MESAEPVLMQRAAAVCTLRIVHCARAPLSGRALCITDRVRKVLQRSAGRILMQQHYSVGLGEIGLKDPNFKIETCTLGFP